EQKMKSNFRSVNIDPKKAYEFIGLKTDAGIKMSWVDLKKKLNQLKSQITGDKAAGFRQIEYVFHYNSSKAEYDAFLQGQPAFEELKKSVTTYTELQQALMDVQHYLILLADIENAIVQKLKK